MSARPLRAVLLLCALASAGGATAASYVVDVWDATRGLPGNAATAIAQTADGYLWIGSYNGLARFDGVRFVAFDPSNTPALRHPRIERLFTDAQGTLWINTHDGSLASWRGGRFATEWSRTERVEPGVYPAISTAREQVFILQSGTVARRVLEAGRTGEWQLLRPPGTTFTLAYCVTPQGELWIGSADGRVWRIAAGRLEDVGSPSALPVRAFAAGPDGRVFAGTHRGLAVWDGRTFVATDPTSPPVDVTFLQFTGNGAFWAIAGGRLRTGRDGRLGAAVDAARSLADGPSQALSAVEDGRGGMWFAHDGRGLVHVDASGVAQRFGPAEGFLSERAVSLFRDREDGVWVGIDRGGLARVRERRFTAVPVPDAHGGYPVVSLAEGADGSVWIGTLGAGVARWRGGALTAFELPQPARRPFVLSIAPAGERLWLSADFEDLWVLEGGRARPAPWRVHGIKVLLLDRAGRLWLGRKDGLSIIESGSLRHFEPPDGVAGVDVRALAEDASGAVWVGTGDGAIYRNRDGAFQRIPLGEGVPVHPVWSLLADRDGVMWAGTYQGGLLRIRDGRVTRYTARDGLVGDAVCQLLDDGVGHLWVGAREGIARLSKESLAAVAEGASGGLAVSTYGRADGLGPLECSGYQPSAFRARDGRLWFATTRGAVSVLPAELRENAVPPPVVIEEVEADHEALALDDPVTVPAGKRDVLIRFTGLGLAAPEAVRFRYRLTGLERDWVDAGDRRTSQYSYLPPGRYRFEVTARNSDGVWSEHEAAVALVVLPHVWETWWFSTLLVAAALGLAAGVARHQATRALRERLERIERQRAVEHDRARIAKDIHDDLGAGLTQISLLSELLRSDRPQEAQAHAEQIGETAADLTRAMDEIVWAVNPTADTLESLWSYLTHFAQEYLGTAGVACRLEAPEVLAALPLRAEVRHNVFLAVKEALHNVVKHAAAKEVRLTLALEPRAFAIEIRDDGRGRGALPSGQRGFAGQGLRNIAERMEAIGARCELVDVPQGGTSVSLHVVAPGAAAS
jgi:ligand-binding sensor domain-containing protein/signal transduction histidine kinase